MAPNKQKMLLRIKKFPERNFGDLPTLLNIGIDNEKVVVGNTYQVFLILHGILKIYLLYYLSGPQLNLLSLTYPWRLVVA